MVKPVLQKYIVKNRVNRAEGDLGDEEKEKGGFIAF